MGGVFPSAPDPDALWELVSRRGCAAGDVPRSRWLLPPEEALDPAKGEPDRVYSARACLVEGFRLDPGGLDLSADTLGALDPVFHLALHAARAAWREGRTAGLDRSRVGVMIGNLVLPTEAASALAREILVPALRELALGESAPGAPGAGAAGPGTHPANRGVAGLPAALIARALGLGGGTLALDAACASSLYAVKLAMDELREGRADAMLAGGVSRPDSLYTQMGFSSLRALSAAGLPRPFDAAADGLVVGEGAGVLLLKRLDDALREGERIHGVIAGAGLSNDVGGSLLAPNTVGQLRAMRAAYQQAGWSPTDIGLIECHATGTPTGDPVEVESLKALWGPRGWTPGSCAIGSVKSNIGHLLTAAGAAGLIKVLWAFRHKQLPPTANFTRTPPGFRLEGSPFRVQDRLADWDAGGRPRRAAVSAFGFGGINAHLLLEEPPAVAAGKPRRSRRPRREPALPVAIVGMGTKLGPWPDLRSFQERVLGGGPEVPIRPPGPRWWGVEQSSWFRGRFLRDGRWSGHYVPEVAVGVGEFRIPPRELAEILPQQALLLQVAAAAIKDARLDDGKEGGPRDRMGVFVGAGLDPNTTNYSVRWALADAARRWAVAKGWRLDPASQRALVGKLRDALGPPLTANRTMGGLASVAASRVAREFHIGGPSFTISSEETSGLRALEAAVRALRRGELDLALVGAVDMAGDVRSVLAANAARPLSAANAARPFDADADGTIPGEGGAAVVLKKLEEAVRDRDRVYAVIRGVGGAGGGGCDRAAADLRAYGDSLRRALAESGVDPSTISYYEAHGSGIPAEDSLEAQALAEVFGVAATPLPCAVGSAKPLIGHAGAAAGLASLVKTALALYQEILPPLPLNQANAELARASARFHAPRRPQYWLRNRAEGPRRAAVAAMGADGSFGHVVLEGLDQGEDPRRAAERRQPLGARAEGLFVVAGEGPAEVASGLSRLKSWAAAQDAADGGELLARRWWQRGAAPPSAGVACALLARGWRELLESASSAETAIRRAPEQAIHEDRCHYTPAPLGPSGKLALVFPGSGNQYLGMDLGLWTQWPEIPRALDQENGYLRGQMVPELFAPWRLSWAKGWEAEAESRVAGDFQASIFASVAHGAAVADLLGLFGARPKAVIGYSLGETTALFATRAWTARDEMLRRMRASSLFVSDLAGPCDAARRFWNLPASERVDWVLGVIDRPAETVKMALKGMERAALLIVNAPLECVVGGYRKAVENLVEGLGCVFLPLQGVSTVHFEAAKLVERKYRELHLLPTAPPDGVAFYSGAWGRAYEVTRESAADSIVSQAVRSVDFPALIRRAYDDGVRLFIEPGPQGSTSRMIGKILGAKPHLARSACQRGAPPDAALLRALAQLSAERAALDLTPLYGSESRAVGHRGAAAGDASAVGIPLGGRVPTPLEFKPPDPEAPEPEPVPGSSPAPAPAAVESPGLVPAAAAPTGAVAAAHGAFLRLAAGFQERQARNIAFQGWLLSQAAPPGPAATGVSGAPPRSLDRRGCLAFATGRVGPVLGPRYASADSFPTRVRLPAPPLMLVDRILDIEGEPLSMRSGRIVTEHDVLAGAWYLDGGRAPTCISVEAGQADLFLSGFLGVDLQTKGERVYRLLDAEVTFHRELPRPGETIRYDIRISRFARQGDVILFFFHFDGTVDGRPLITMRKGCAGFFTPTELAAGRGVVLTTLDRRPRAGKRPADWRDLAPVPAGRESYGDEQLAALRRGDLGSCFGPAFARVPGRPFTLPGGTMKLIDRVLSLEAGGGRYGLGLIKAEADIRPDDWHLVCHFSDDNVMPGTLMYECCLHTLRVMLLRLGWVAPEGSWTEPVPGVPGVLQCRGQVVASTRKAQYEVHVKELGYGEGGEPYAVADALMYADGRLIVQMQDMSLRLRGTTRAELESLWSGMRSSGPREVPEGHRHLPADIDNSYPLRSPFGLHRELDVPHVEQGGAGHGELGPGPSSYGRDLSNYDNSARPDNPTSRGAAKVPLFGPETIRAFAVGKPSAAFGEPYRIFDEGRVIARLPGPPYQFLDRIVDIKACAPFKLAAGGEVSAEYDVPPDAWYFGANRQKSMPFGILLEVGLQPCGWLSAYVGSALASETDLSYRNLGGKAVLRREVFPDSGTLITRIKMTKLSQSAGMIIQNFDFEIWDSRGPLYAGDTYFGFFTKKALADQVGIRGKRLYEPSAAEARRFVPVSLQQEGSALPDERLLMLDSIDLFVPDGGPSGLGFIRGIKHPRPQEWFFKAHFFQDPVWPGSLGLEAFLQLLKIAAGRRWGARGGGFEAFAVDRPHEWAYRGQVIPGDRRVTVEAAVTHIDDASGLIVADGFLTVDGRVIYQMKDFAIRLAGIDGGIFDERGD